MDQDEDKVRQNNSHHIFLSLLILLLGYLFQSTIWNLNDDPIVETSYGKLRGQWATSRDGKKYKEFLSIPYAKTPKRFQPPEPPESWNGIRSAQTLGPECIAFEFLTTGRVVGQEDCLFLNIYVSESNTNETYSGSKKSVIVYIHGGGFAMGSSYIHGAKYLMTEDIILVTLNYRLGPFGFLSTGDNVIKGNMGLKDQVMALKFVQNEIERFGGDPNKVTIVGESAGGISVHLHMMSPMSRGLFQRAISMSGTGAHFDDALMRNQSEVAMNLGSKLNCPTWNTRKLVACLENASAHEIVSTQMDTTNPFAPLKDFFLPTVEIFPDSNSFLIESPMESLKNGNYSSVPFMIGLLNSEGLIYVLRLIQNNVNPTILKQRSVWRQYMPHLLLLDNYKNAEEISDKIYEFYFGNVNLENQTDEQVTATIVNVFSDKFFYSGAHYAAKVHANVSSVYLYYLTHQMSMSVFDILSMTSPGSWIPFEVEIGYGIVKRFITSTLFGWEDVSGLNYNKNKRSCHGDDVPLVFDTSFFIDWTMSREDVHMSRSLVRLLADFAKDT